MARFDTGYKKLTTVLLLVIAFGFTGCCNYFVTTASCDEFKGKIETGGVRFKLCDSQFKLLDANKAAVSLYPEIFSDQPGSVPLVFDSLKQSTKSGSSVSSEFLEIISTLTLTAFPRINVSSREHKYKVSLPFSVNVKKIDASYKLRYWENESMFPLGLIPVGFGQFHEYQIDQFYNNGLDTISTDKLNELKNSNMAALALYTLSKYELAEITSCIDLNNLGKKAKLAISGDDLKIAIAVVQTVTDQAFLSSMAAEAASLDVRRAAFMALNPESLKKLAETAADEALRIASTVRLGQQGWTELFAETSSRGQTLGNVLGAVALVNDPAPSPRDVVKACHTYIRQGNESRLTELRYLLLKYGDKTLAEDYLNCGKSELASAAREWASKHGYRESTGNGSARVRWGSQRR